jgi:hypothetical protein
MTISLSSFANMKTEFESLPAGNARDWSLSVLEVARWLIDGASDDDDIVVGRYRLGRGVAALQLDPEDEPGDAGDPDAVPPIPPTPPSRVWRIHDDGSVWFWDVVDQTMRRAAEGLEAGKDEDTLRADARISGTFVDALNEVEKARLDIEARL